MRATVFIVNASSRIYSIDLSNVFETPLPEIFLWLVVEWLVCLGSLYYFENVLSIGYGVRSSPCFCLPKSIQQLCSAQSKMKDTKTAIAANNGSNNGANNGLNDVLLSNDFMSRGSASFSLPEVKTSSSYDNHGLSVDVAQEKERVLLSMSTASTATTCCAGTAGLYAPRQPLQQLQCISARQGAIRVMCTRCVLVQFYSNYVLIRLVLLMSMCEEDEG